jgi:hypothetical protein
VDADRLPRKFGRYAIVETLGVGGMGVVLSAVDPTLKRKVAVKVIPEEFGRSATSVERLRREAVVLAKLNHPNVVRVFDVGEEQGYQYYVMELLQGQSLDRRVPGQAFDPREFVRIFAPLAEALQAIHDSGIVHRDIKPANIFVDVPERGAVLTDFGLTFAEGQERLTMEGMVVGTVRYAAPEQLRGDPPSPLSDQFSLGASMFEFASGKQPFQEVQGPELILVRSETPMPSVLSAAPWLPAEVAGIIDRCLQFHASARFPDAAALRRALLAIPVEPSGSVEVPRPEPVRRPSVKTVPARRRRTGRRSRRFLLLVSVVAWTVLLSALVAAWAVRPGRKELAEVAPPAVPMAAGAAQAEGAGTRGSLEPPALVELARAGTCASSVVLAGMGERLLAAWLGASGQVELSLSVDRGASWRRPPASGALAARPRSSFCLLGAGSLVHLLFAREGADEELHVWSSSCGLDAAAWTEPVRLGKAHLLGGRLEAAAEEPSSGRGRILAAWDVGDGAQLNTAWWVDGHWKPGGLVPAGEKRGPFTLAIPEGRAAVMIWERDIPELESRQLFLSRCLGPGAPWSAPAPLMAGGRGLEFEEPMALASGPRVYLAWTEYQFPASPLMAGVSLDGGRTFRTAGQIVWPHGKGLSPRMAVHAGRWWASWTSPPGQDLVWSVSEDRGSTWRRPRRLPAPVRPDTRPGLAALTGGQVWAAWPDREGAVHAMELR